MIYRHFINLFPNRTNGWTPAAVLALAIAGLNPAHGAISTWTNGGNDNSWGASSSVSDWSPSGLPSASGTVFFGTGGTTSPITIGTASVGVIDFGGYVVGTSTTTISGEQAYTLGASAGSGTINVGAGNGNATLYVVNYYGAGNTATETINANLNLGNSTDTDVWYFDNYAPGLLEFSGTISRVSTGAKGNLWIGGSGTTVFSNTSLITGFGGVAEGGSAGSTAVFQGAVHISGALQIGNSYNGSFGNILLETGGPSLTNSGLIAIYAGAGGAGTLQLEGNLDLSAEKVQIADARYQAGGGGGGSAFIENISGNTSIGQLSILNPNAANSGSYINVALDSGTLAIASIGTLASTANTPNTQSVYFYGSGNGNAVVTGSISDTGGGVNGYAPIAIEENNASGTLTLQGANNYRGGTTLDAGTLVAANTQAFGAAGSVLTLNGGILDLATDSSVNAYNVTVTSPATILSDKATAGSAGITQTLGTLSIGSGTLNVQAGASVSGGIPAVTFGATTLTGGTSTFNPTTASVTLNSVTGQGTSGTDTIDLDGTGAGTISGAVTDSGSGAVTAIAKTNSGTWTLAGTNTNTGATSITAGTLILTGTLGSGQTTVTNATLEGTGALTGALTVNAGGVLAPGATGTGSPGTLNTASVTFVSTATLSYTLNSNNVGSSDLLDVVGSLTLNGARLSAVDIGSTLLAGNTTIELAGYTSLFGTFNNLADGSDITIGVNTFQINYGTLDANEITLEAVGAVPEPSTYGLLLLGFVLIGGRLFFRRGLIAQKRLHQAGCGR